MFPLKTILITNDQGIATDAQAAGVRRIMVDLEINGKKERQASRSTFISSHTRKDIPLIRQVVKSAELVVRINGWNAESVYELDYALGEGADLIMLPMITSMVQLESFLDHLGGRARPLPLLETAYSMAHVSTITAHPAIQEVFIGLNDLHLSLGLDFLFEPLALGIIDWMAGQVKAHDKSFGFGGIATVHSGELPAERILGEHVRLGSSGVILSSRFCKDVQVEIVQGRQDRMQAAMKGLQVEYHRLSKRNLSQQHEDAKHTAHLIQQIAARVRTRQSF